MINNGSNSLWVVVSRKFDSIQPVSMCIPSSFSVKKIAKTDEDTSGKTFKLQAQQTIISICSGLREWRSDGTEAS